MRKTLDLHALKVKGSVLGPCALMTGDIWGGDEDFSRRGSAERVHHAGRGLFPIVLIACFPDVQALLVSLSIVFHLVAAAPLFWRHQGWQQGAGQEIDSA